MGFTTLSTALSDLDISLEKSNVFGYLTAPAITTTGLAGTYYNILGTFANPILENFTADATGITYTGTETRTFKVIMSVSASSDTSTTEVSTGIAKNYVVAEGCVSSRILKLTTDVGAWVTQCELTLEPGDLVTLQVKTDKSSVGINFKQLQANIFPTTHFKE